MTRLKIHHMAEGGTAQADISARCDVPLRSVQRILAEPVPTLDEVRADMRSDAPRLGRPAKADAAMVARVRALLEDDRNAHISAIEVLRRAKEWGYGGGRSQMTALVRSLRPAPRKDPVVLFNGVPGEYAQFDFGEALITFGATGQQRVQFFAGRLKHSRYMHVVMVTDQTAETVVRSLIACLVAFGGSPKEWVFDNPKTMRASPIGTTPIVLHRYLGQLVAEYNVIATFCAPASGNQKGTVERLVGFVKNSFLRQRTFRDMGDLEVQLAVWLTEVNTIRKCDATGVSPAVLLAEETPRLARRPVQCTPEDWAIATTVTVTPMGTIPVNGTSYSATDTKLGAPATVHLRARRIDIDIRGERCSHVREDHTGEVRRLPVHRESMLAALHGRRKVTMFRRQCLLELGQPAWLFLGELIHVEPCGRWEEPCEQLFNLLTHHSDDAMRTAFSRCVTQKRYTVDAVRAALAAA